MKIEKAAKDIKTYLFLAGLIITMTAGAVGFAKLPKKVEEVEKKAEENKDNIQKLSYDITSYIKVQAEREKAQERREELMYKLLERLNERGNYPN